MPPPWLASAPRCFFPKGASGVGTWEFPLVVGAGAWRWGGDGWVSVDPEGPLRASGPGTPVGATLALRPCQVAS